MSPYDSSQIDNFFDAQTPKGSGPSSQGWWQRFKSRFPSRQQLSHFPRVLSKTERFIVILFSIVALGALVAIPISAYIHFTEATPAHGGKFSEALVGYPKLINPLLLQANDADRDVTALVYSGLMRYDGKGGLEPDLAESYAVSENGLTYTFKIRQNAFWHDGQQVTAEDVVFTILTAQNPEYSSPQRVNWQSISAEATDNFTVVLTLKNRTAQFINFTTMGILPKHIWENVTPTNFDVSELNLKPNGSGPYRITELVRTSEGAVREMKLDSFKNYHFGEPYIARIDLKFFETQEDAINAYREGRVESISFVSSNTTPKSVASNQAMIQAIHIPRYFAAFFNQSTNEALKDSKVREALTIGTNRDQLLENVLGGNGIIALSPLIPGVIAIDEPDDLPAFDSDRAKALLDEAGWQLIDGSTYRSKTVQGESTELTVTITTISFLELPDAAEELAAQWGELGVHVELRILGRSEIQQAIQDRAYEIILFGQIVGLDPDPFSFWHSSQVKNPGLNIALYNSQRADTLLEEARDTLDNATRLAKYDELQNLILKDFPAVFLYSPDYIYIQPRKITHPELSVIGIPSDRFSKINEWYIETRRTQRSDDESTSETSINAAPEASSTPPLE